MTDQVKTLSKMMICYQMMYMSDDRTKAISAVVASLKLIFRRALTYQEKVYREAEKYQIELYDEAWNICFTKGEGQVIEIGTIVNIIYESIDPNKASKFIGAKKMEKAITSYFLANEDCKDAYEVETRSTNFAEKILELYDGKKEISKFQRMMNIKKQNHVVETGENWDEFKQTKDICDSKSV